VLGIVAFRASRYGCSRPWPTCAGSDATHSAAGDELKQQGLLEKDTSFETVDQVLDGWRERRDGPHRRSTRCRSDVASLRAEWNAIRDEARRLPAASMPSSETIVAVWERLRAEAVAQERSVFETSSAMALSAIRTLPEGLRWLSASAVAGAGRTGRVVGAALLEHYRDTLDEVRQTGTRTTPAGSWSVRQGRRRAVFARAAHPDRAAPQSLAKSPAPRIRPRAGRAGAAGKAGGDQGQVS
jgi:hypothetical protein